MQQLSLDVRIVLPASLDNFVAGPNQELLTLLRQIVAGQRPSSCLYIWGESGSGKSHLATAFRAHISTGARLSLLEDCQDLSGQAQEDGFNRFIALASETSQDLRTPGNPPKSMLIALADRPPLQLALREDLRSRLGSGLIYQLRRLSDEDKAQALRQHALGRQIKLPEELLRYLLRHYPRDIRALMLILDSLDRYAFEQKRALSLPLLREMESQTSARGAG
jgi:DnaA-homolog protein